MPPNFAAAFKKQHQQNGFTLLELIVVIVIVAILFTYTTLAIRGNAPEDAIQEEAKRLERLIELALEEAVLRGEDYGVEFFSDGYRFLRQNDNGKYEVISQDDILRDRTLPEKMEQEVHLEDSPLVTDLAAEPLSDNELGLTDSEDSEEANDSDGDGDGDGETKTLYPHIFLLSSGEIVPDFDTRFYLPNVKTSYIVKGLFDGTLSTEISDL